MKKLSLILILLTIAAAIPVFAVEPPPVFNAMYWLRGTLTMHSTTPAASQLLTNRTVVFYKVLPGAYVSAVPYNVVGDLVKGSASYMLNMYNHAALPIDPTATYYAAVAKDPIDKYGANPKEVKITGNGFEVVDFTLEYDQGPVLPLPGAVQLFIARSGNDIKLTWNDDELTADQKPPKIFGLNKAAGGGAFDNAKTDWVDITSSLVKNVNGKDYLHTQQVGGGATEYYYKAMWKDKVKDDVYNGASILESAWAVGKFNVDLAAGWNLVAEPTIFQGGSDVSQVIGNQLTANNPTGDEVYTAQLDKAIYSNNTWNKAMAISLGEGFYVNLVGAAKKMTFVGDVPTQKVAYTVPKGYLRIGNSSCVTRVIGKAGFTNAFGGDANNSGDEIYNNNLLKMTRQGNAWLGTTVFDFNAAGGFWYNRSMGASNALQWDFDPLLK
ncbi:MAG: hypothetical protein WCW67_04655 [Candidatus Margulisiibacteriota bacterium]